ncbi:MAG: ABC transporter ATP-binding protein [Planctomycetota bacterium]
MSARLIVTGVAKAYPGLKVLNGLNLTLESGEIIAVRGASGTGKSTLLHCLGLLDRPDVGSIVLDGEELTQLSDSCRTAMRAQRIGFVFQAFHLLSDFTVVENVTMAARTAGLEPQAARARAEALLTRVGLGGRDGDIRTLSGGERQRVALCRALLTKPALLLADEPTGNLDPTTARIVLGEIVALAKDSGSSVIIVTHDADVAARADKRYELKDGRLELA